MSIALTPWQQRAWNTLGGSLAADRLGHALLLVGQAQLGKRQLATALAQRLLCTQLVSPQDIACGICRSCRLFAAGTHPDFNPIGIELNEKTGKQRSEILVEQIRRLSQWFSLTAQFSGAQVAIIEPAEAMKGAAANALLKTLEEPLPGRYLILVTAQPARISATIRSRCQRVELRLPSALEARAWMRQNGADAAQIDDALTAAEGNPGLALAYLNDHRLALRNEVRRDLAALAAGRERAMSVALRWADEATSERLRFAAEVARDIGRMQFSDQRDPGMKAAGLTVAGDFPKLAAWFDETNRTRQLLDAPLRADLLLCGLLEKWGAAMRR
ncbi:MAG: DNA polymerase III subunit delta' [Pseudomarimonas sp.]